jgi:AcrR family transcriptional regulator
MTRERICAAARHLFAEQGFDRTSNRQIADEAGLTTGAIYHYFDRKLDIFTAVYQDTQRMVYERFDKAVALAPSFTAKLRALLESAHEMNNEDPSIALFLGACRIDATRNAEVAAIRADFDDGRQESFFVELVDFGVMTGEIDAADRQTVREVLRVLTVGLVDGVSGDRERHRRSIDGIARLFEARLVRPLVDGSPSG